MNATRLKVTLTAIGLVLLSSSALAQGVDEVKVQATRIVNTAVDGRSPSGIPIVDLSLTYGVSLAGLDLATNSGANAAEKRVHDAALAACEELGRQYPNSTPSNQECARAAIEKAMPRVHELVLAAEQTTQRR